MFTGIIEATGKIKSIQSSADGARITIAVGKLDMSDVKLGDSIATNGVCLTAIAFDQQSYTADVSNETLSRTVLGQYKADDAVNLEKAMLPTTRFGGHMVSGHVDAISSVASIKQNGNSVEYWFTLSDEIAPYVAEKGSITIDGVSLTVNAVTETQFRLTIVPHTIAETIIGHYQVGSQVNVEVDLVARYLERLLSVKKQPETPSGVTHELLMKSGFINK
jgi:riboflavin synthase